MRLTKSGLSIKAIDDAGTGVARIALMSEIDHDDDTYAPGAFSHSGDQWAQILVAHNWEKVPLGKARVYEQGDEVLAELHLNLETMAGKEWHSALKFDLENLGNGAPPVQEWSYGFHVLDAAPEDRDGKRVRVLKKLKVFEVSPVVQGAGIGTGTLALKSGGLKEDYFKRLSGDIAEVLATVKSDPSRLTAAGLKQIADLHEGLGKLLEQATADEDAARKMIAAQVYRASKRYLPEGV